MVALRHHAQPVLRRIAWWHALTRALIGIGLLVRPTAARPWFGDGVNRGGGRVALQAFAVREAAVGIGIMRSLAVGHPVRRWFQLGVAFEVVDAASTVAQRQHLPSSRVPDLVTLFAASGAVGGTVLGLLLEN